MSHVDKTEDHVSKLHREYQDHWHKYAEALDRGEESVKVRVTVSLQLCCVCACGVWLGRRGLGMCVCVCVCVYLPQCTCMFP